ncbi:hypothetical protein DPEC_G00361470 [Dallia pectoralis]|nr:hypothetical protein DPEC_G00361470 [Dallia pectoralis]
MRAEQEVLYEQRVILDSVNSALASFRFASSPIDEDQVLIMRAQQHSDIQSLMKSNLDQEADLSEVLQSLQDMRANAQSENGQARLKAEDCIAKEQLEGNRRRINQLEAEKHQLQEAMRRSSSRSVSCSTQEKRFGLRLRRIIRSGLGSGDGSTKSPGDMHKQIANDCKLHLFPPTPRPSNSSKVVTDKPCKSTRSQNTVRRCHRLPPDSSGYPLDLVQASRD